VFACYRGRILGRVLYHSGSEHWVITAHPIFGVCGVVRASIGSIVPSQASPNSNRSVIFLSIPRPGYVVDSGKVASIVKETSRNLYISIS